MTRLVCNIGENLKHDCSLMAYKRLLTLSEYVAEALMHYNRKMETMPFEGDLRKENAEIAAKFEAMDDNTQKR